MLRNVVSIVWLHVQAMKTASGLGKVYSESGNIAQP